MKQGITIELDKPRTMRYGMNALIKIEELTGKQITKLDLDNLSIKDLRTIIYAGLFHEDPTLTPDQCADLVDGFSSVTEVAQKIGEAMSLAFGDAQGN
jgi:hypothetical protein